jgi:hypothetical protein
MWSVESSRRMIKKITKVYGKEILQEGSEPVLGLEDHLDEMVAKAMNIDKSCVSLARQWRIVIERAAITEGIDKVKVILEQETNIESVHSKSEEIVVEEVKMLIEDKIKLEGNVNNIEKREIKLVGEIAKQIVLNKVDSYEEEPDMIVEENHITENKDYKEETRLMEDVKVIQEEETETLNSDQQSTRIKETDKEMIITEESNSSLNNSIWAPSKDRCESKGTIRAKVTAIKVLGDNAKHREKSLRWSIGRNVHLKKISERFERGNLWCILTFDCRKGFEEAKEKLETKKEDFEQAKLILEDSLVVEQDKEISTSLRKSNSKQNAKETRETREEVARKELEEILQKRGENTFRRTEDHKSREDEELTIEQVNRAFKKVNDSNSITVWDLPTWVKRSMVFEIVRFIGRVEHIEMIKGNFSKTRAVVEFKADTFDKERVKEIWCLPFADQLLVRVTVGNSNHELLQERNRFSTRLLNLPENTNEVLLWRQVRRTGAKAVHIFRNSNNNKMGSATIFFRNQAELAYSSKYAVYYNNSKLKWAISDFQNINITSKYRVGDDRESGMQQRRSLKSLGKKRDNEQEQTSECSKFAQNRNKIQGRGEVETTIRDTESTAEESWKDFNQDSSSTEGSEIESYKRKEEEYYRKKSSFNNKKKINNQNQRRNSNSSLSYIAQLMQNLETKLSELGVKSPNRS